MLVMSTDFFLDDVLPGGNKCGVLAPDSDGEELLLTGLFFFFFHFARRFWNQT